MLSDIQPDVDKANLDIQEKVASKDAQKLTDERVKRESKKFEELGRLELKQQDAISKSRQGALENFGSDRDRMLARQSRERSELDKATGGDADSLSRLDAAHAVEAQKLKISDKEKALGMLGHDAGPTAGLDINSSEGISAINRALSGAGEHSIGMQQLEVERNQLRILEEIARGGPDAKAFSDAMNNRDKEPTLGKAEVLHVGGEPGLFKPDFDPSFTAPEKNPEIYNRLGRKREREILAGNEVYDTLAPKREREGKQAVLADEKMKRILEQIRDNAKSKPVSRVVALSGG